MCVCFVQMPKRWACIICHLEEKTLNTQNELTDISFRFCQRAVRRTAVPSPSYCSLRMRWILGNHRKIQRLTKTVYPSFLSFVAMMCAERAAANYLVKNLHGTCFIKPFKRQKGHPTRKKKERRNRNRKKGKRRIKNRKSKRNEDEKRKGGWGKMSSGGIKLGKSKHLKGVFEASRCRINHPAKTKGEVPHVWRDRLGWWVGGISIKRHQHSGRVLWTQERQHDHLQGRQAAAVRQRGCWASFTKCYDRKLRVLANTQPEARSLHSFTNDVTLRKWLEWGDWESQRLKWKSEMKDSLRNQGELRKTSKGNPAVVFRTRKFFIQCISLPVFWA